MDSWTESEKEILPGGLAIVWESFCMTQSSGRLQQRNPSEPTAAASGCSWDTESRGKSGFPGQVGPARAFFPTLPSFPPLHTITSRRRNTSRGIPESRTKQNTNKSQRQERSNGHVLRARRREWIIKVKLRRKVGEMCGIPLPPADSLQPCVCH